MMTSFSDSSRSTLEKVTSLKEKGNLQFREKQYDDCIDTYSEAINEIMIMVCYDTIYVVYEIVSLI